jgi:transcriptional regulator with XRE-family HTH domain
MTIGAFLRQKRTEKNLSLRDVEAAVGISNAYLSQLENDYIKKPSPFFLHKLAKLYDCPYQELLLAAEYITTAIVRVKCPCCGTYVEVKEDGAS